MNKFQTKDYGGMMSDVDTKTRVVKAVVAVFNNVDLDNDIIVPEAVTKTIQERGPNGKKLIVNLVDHIPTLKTLLGKPKELYVDGNQLISVTPVVETECGEDYIKLCDAGVINQYSIGFSTIKSTMKDEVRIITELKLYEYSAVIWAANPETSMIGIKGEFKSENNPESLVKRLEKLSAAFKNGTFTDETFSLMEIEIKQIQAQILALSTQPVVPTVEPLVDRSAEVDAIKQASLTIKNLLQNGSK